MSEDRNQDLTAETVLRLIRSLPAKELYRLADIMDFGDDGMWSQDIHEAVEKFEYEWSSDGEPVVSELSLGLCLPSIMVKITYENIAANGDEPDYGEYKTEIIEARKQD